MTLLSIFDLDRTITRSGTWVPWLAFWLRREAPWRVVLLQVLALVGLAYLARVIDRGRLKEIGMALLMGRGVHRARVDAAALAFAERMVASNVFPGALAQIAADRAEGRRIVIATASNAFYVRAIAARLGIVDVVATAMRWDGDRLRPQLAGPNCYGAAKRALVDAWLAREGLAAAPLRFYSDHISDLPLFERADEPVAATPSPALRALASARGWRIVDWGVASGSLFERA